MNDEQKMFLCGVFMGTAVGISFTMALLTTLGVF